MTEITAYECPECGNITKYKPKGNGFCGFICEARYRGRMEMKKK